ncbi:MAG: hypothetical protein Q8K98_08335 [Bacteroidota bacterium]|nr:hypothetical protein [Bacteroidota bacterium]
MKTPIIFVSILLFSILLVGCASTADAVRSKHEGTTQVYDISPEQAWSVAKTVMQWEGATEIEEHKEQNYITASVGMTAVSWGAVVAVWVETFGKEYSKVTVVTKRRMQTNIFTSQTEGSFQERFAQAVDILKSGKPLPSSPPGTTQTDK